MLINFKVKTLDAQTHEFSVDNEITVRELKDKIAEKTSISADRQRIIYCGRVLADERQIKEFDVDGKVLHVAERPPPSQGGPSTSSRANDNPPIRERDRARTMRNSPFFRTWDGLVVGNVSLPNNNGGPIVNPFASSSSFCMNRITVARHMLQCADNIAAYLENPERGLNNTSLDILQRGRWTMESTLVEVGISSADLPQGHNLVEMVQGAVTAALRGDPSNVTVVQLPHSFGPDNAVDEARSNEANNSDNTTATAVIIRNVSGSDDETNDDEVIDGETIEDVEVNVEEIDDDNFISIDDVELHDEPNMRSEPVNFGTLSSSGDSANSANSGNDTSTTNTSSNSLNNDQGPRRRTPPTVLAEVIELWRNVQNRLNPFIDQFYNLLNNEPTFQEGTTQREDAQRLFDRVSEAFHYMSHATHAISDLMLNFSIPTPRYLTCRPILVEQSGYISSNNFLAGTPIVIRNQMPPTNPGNRRNFMFQQRQTQTDNARRNVNSQATNTNITGNISTANNATPTPRFTESAETPTTPIIRPQARQVNSTNVGTQSTDTSHIPMARLIQAVVNGAPIETEFHLQINAPMLSFGNPLNVASVHATDPPPPRPTESSQRQGAGAGAGTGTGAAAAGTGAAAASSTTDIPQIRSNTATLPTISTQTRPTSRPQVQMVGFPGASRIMPSPVVHSFDRFLPCNSHHIRDSQNPNSNNNIRSNNNRGSTRSSSEPRTVINAPQRRGSNAVTLRSILQSLGSNNAAFDFTPPDVDTSIVDDDDESVDSERDSYRNNLRDQLLSFINERIFRGNTINDENMPRAIERVVRWFTEKLIFLPQYEKAEYDSRDSLVNVIRQTMPIFINLLIDPLDTAFEFEENLRQLCEQLINRLFSVLDLCVGSSNAELYWGQLMRLILIQLRKIKNFREEALNFLRIYINPAVPTARPDIADAQKFVVLRKKGKKSASTSQDNKFKSLSSGSGRSNSSDIDMTDVPSTSSSSSSARTEKRPRSAPLFISKKDRKETTDTNTEATPNQNLSQKMRKTEEGPKERDDEKSAEASTTTTETVPIEMATIISSATLSDITDDITELTTEAATTAAAVAAAATAAASIAAASAAVATSASAAIAAATATGMGTGVGIETETTPSTLSLSTSTSSSVSLSSSGISLAETTTAPTAAAATTLTVNATPEDMLSTSERTSSSVSVASSASPPKTSTATKIQPSKSTLTASMILPSTSSAAAAAAANATKIASADSTEEAGAAALLPSTSRSAMNKSLSSSSSSSPSGSIASASSALASALASKSAAKSKIKSLKESKEESETEQDLEPAEPMEPLPTVEIGSEAWHSEFPPEWIPLITRDIRVLNQDTTTPGPFSDAYIAGMSAKRRKMIQNSKPAATPSGLLTDNLRTVLQTVQNTSNNSNFNESDITQITDSIINDTAVQASYTEALRSSIGRRIRTDPNFEPSQFDEIRKFLDKQ